MGDQHRRLALDEVGKAKEDLVFSAGVEGGGRLVEDEQLGIAHVGAGQRDFLPLAAGEVHAFGKALPEHLLVAFRQFCHYRIRQALRGGRLDHGHIGHLFDVADGNVFPGLQLEADIVLKNDAYIVAQALQVVIPDINPVDEDAPPGGFVQAGEQFDQGGLAGAIFSHQGELFASL